MSEVSLSREAPSSGTPGRWFNGAGVATPMPKPGVMGYEFPLARGVVAEAPNSDHPPDGSWIDVGAPAR